MSSASFSSAPPTRGSFHSFRPIGSNVTSRTKSLLATFRDQGLAVPLQKLYRSIRMRLPLANGAKTYPVDRYIAELRDRFRVEHDHDGGCRVYSIKGDIDVRMQTAPASIENLILQRSTPFSKLGGSQHVAHWLQSGEKGQLYRFLVGNGLLDTYLMGVWDEILQEVDQFLVGLGPHIIKNAVSIGPGNGLFELALFKRRGYQRILLIDIEQTVIHKHSFAESGSGYAALGETKEFLSSNGVPADAIETCNPQKHPLPEFEFDLLISLLSMGFHYPCNDYVSFIRTNGQPESVVVLDKRRGTRDPGFDEIRAAFFERGRVVAKKSDRWFLGRSSLTH